MSALDYFTQEASVNTFKEKSSLCRLLTPLPLIKAHLVPQNPFQTVLYMNFAGGKLWQQKSF